MKYKFDTRTADDYGLDDEYRDQKRNRRESRNKRYRDSFEAQDHRWDRWN